MNAVVTPRVSNDFADWLSPILVKELRQGLKTRVFVGVFIFLQVTMVMVMGFRLLLMTNNGTADAEFLDVIFWIVVWVPLLLIMPARGLGAVSAEVKANTLDLVQLTKLTAFRIVLGKWVALVAQTLLLVAAVLPYLVLRYFFGKVDVVMDLMMLMGMLQGSLLLTAVAVMLSSMSLVVRVLVLMLGLPTLLSLGSMSFMLLIGRSLAGSGVATISAASQWVQWGIGVVVLFASVYFLLEIAAGRIAPVVENHVGRRRAAVGFLALLTPLVFWKIELDGTGTVLWFYGVMPLLVWSVLESLCERTVQTASLYRPFAKFGWVGRMVGRVFYPGWASGIIYVSILAAFLSLSLIGVGYVKNPSAVMKELNWIVLTMVMLFTGVVAPVLVVRRFNRMKYPIVIYLSVQVLLMLLYAVAWIIAESPSMNHKEVGDSMAWLSVFPLTGGVAVLFFQHAGELLSACRMIGVPVCAVIWVSLLVLMWKEFRVIRELEREALQVGEVKG